MEKWSKVMETGATPPVDIFPFLKLVPEGLFGNWVSRSREVGDAMQSLYGRMVQRVVKRRETKGNHGSFLDGVLDQQKELNLTQNQLNFLGGVLMEGGSDTSSSMILAVVQAMAKWENVQKKAQQEIDSVIDETRSPLWSDYDKLPYVSMIIKEVMRWRPVTPMAFPHCTSAGEYILLKPGLFGVVTNTDLSCLDDWVDGMFVPKGTVVLLNVWGLHHNPETFPEPDVFKPERYTNRTLLAAEYAASADYENRDHYGYGSGRRICPGIHLAERNLFLAISKLLWAFSFSPGKDSHGNPVPIDVSAYSEGFLHCPKPFPCEIKPRSEARRETIMREFGEAERKVFSKYEY
jgi:cytochrome P450